MKVPRLVFVLLLSLACGKKEVPEKFRALGIPADPERVLKIEEHSGAHTTYTVVYKVAPSGEGLGAMLGKIEAAGYKKKMIGTTLMVFEGRDGKFSLDCGSAQGEYACRLDPSY